MCAALNLRNIFMENYKLVFKLEYKFLCWGILESELSDTFETEIKISDGMEFTLRHQHKANFKVSGIKRDKDGVFVTLICPNKTQILRLNEKAAFNYEEDFEQYTDCNTNVYSGTVELKEN